MKIGDLKRRLKDWNEFKKDSEKYQESGDKNRTVELKKGEKAHPGANDIKAEPAYTRHDSNYYKAAGIEVDKEHDNSNNYVKAGLTPPHVKEEKDQEKAQAAGYAANYGGALSQGEGISEGHRYVELYENFDYTGAEREYHDKENFKQEQLKKKEDTEGRVSPPKGGFDATDILDLVELHGQVDIYVEKAPGDVRMYSVTQDNAEETIDIQNNTVYGMDQDGGEEEINLKMIEFVETVSTNEEMSNSEDLYHERGEQEDLENQGDDRFEEIEDEVEESLKDNIIPFDKFTS